MIATSLKNFLTEKNEDTHLAGISVDCVIFGFHDGVLKILLNKLANHDKWMLPGGFVRINESVDSAACRVLKFRTGLNEIYLKQFHLFGNEQRTNIEENKQMLVENNVSIEDGKWFLQRFASMGYYAFIDYSSAKVQSQVHEITEWFAIDDVPKLYSDHNTIVTKAITTIRNQAGRIPVGFALLPEKFTASELRTIYETILDQKLDRRNFQKKMLSTGLIYKLDEISKKWGVKGTTLFSFDKEKYMVAIENDGNIMDLQ